MPTGRSRKREVDWAASLPPVLCVAEEAVVKEVRCWQTQLPRSAQPLCLARPVATLSV